VSETISELLRGAIATRVLGVVAELRVADALAAGQRSAFKIAEEVEADPAVLERFLRALSREGVFAETSVGVFANTEASEALAGSGAWNAFAQLYGGVWHRAAGRRRLRAGRLPRRADRRDPNGGRVSRRSSNRLLLARPKRRRRAVRRGAGSSNRLLVARSRRDA
jgi:methyltransferase family protein